jgi:hypothetical protein
LGWIVASLHRRRLAAFAVRCAPDRCDRDGELVVTVDVDRDPVLVRVLPRREVAQEDLTFVVAVLVRDDLVDEEVMRRAGAEVHDVDVEPDVIVDDDRVEADRVLQLGFTVVDRLGRRRVLLALPALALRRRAEGPVVAQEQLEHLGVPSLRALLAGPTAPRRGDEPRPGLRVTTETRRGLLAGRQGADRERAGVELLAAVIDEDVGDELTGGVADRGVDLDDPVGVAHHAQPDGDLARGRRVTRVGLGPDATAVHVAVGVQ